MKFRKGIITATGPPANGATTNVDLSSVFSVSEPLRAVFFWAAYATADGTSDDDGIFSFGWATNDGGSIQQCYVSYFDEGTGTVGTSATARGQNNTAALKLLSASAASPTVDMEMDVTGFTEDDFTVTWTDAPASAIVIHYVAIGGADVDAARAFTFTTSTAVATQDVTVDTGWGQPDLVFMSSVGGTSLGESQSAAILALSAAADGVGRFEGFDQQHGEATMDTGVYHSNEALVVLRNSAGVPAIDAIATMSAVASWPTDGFELSYSDQASQATQITALAIRGTFTYTISSDSAPTAGGLPVVDNLSHSAGTPRGAIFWGIPQAATGALVTAPGTATDVGFFIGAVDEVPNEGSAGVTQQDAHTSSQAGRWHSTAKAIKFYSATTGAAPTLNSEADGSVGASSVDLSWNDIDSVARVFSYVIFGDEASSAQNITINPATETDAAQALDVDKHVVITHASETDTAQTLSIGGGQEIAITHASETDTAQALTFEKTIVKTVTAATETDAAQALDKDKHVTVTAATETDSASPTIPLRPITPATETDSAQPLSYSQAGAYQISPVAETDTAQALDVVKTILKTILPALENDSAQATDKDKHVTAVHASETDTAQPVAFSKDTDVTISPATETDIALPLDFGGTKAISFALESDSAVELTLHKSVDFATAIENDSAQTLQVIKPILVTIHPALETDSAALLPVGGVRAIDPVLETDAAVALIYGTRSPSGFIVGAGGAGRIATARRGRVATVT